MRHLRIVTLVVSFLLLTGITVWGRPYHGDRFTFHQPDGIAFEVRLFGDEFYAVAETLDGFPLVKDPQSGFYCYALVAPDGGSFLSTGIRAENPPPLATGIVKKARLVPSATSRISREARNRFGYDERGRLVPSLRLRLRPRDFGYESWTPEIETLAQSLESSSLQAASIPQPAPPATTTTGTRIGLVLLASFPDRPGDVTIPQAEVDAYTNDPAYQGFGNATSVYGYFNIQSEGKLQYNSIVTAYFTAANPRDYYTDPAVSFGDRAKELINEGLAVLKAQGFDFTRADGDGDGILDGVNIFYAGSRVNNWSDGLWPHKWSSFWDGLAGEGVSKYFQYQITNIGSSLTLGTYCHENGHMICGFPDLYSYDGNAANLGRYTLMHSSGSTHPVSVDAYLKSHAGWARVIDIDSTSHLRGLVQVDRNSFYRYRNPARSDEYFLFSMRTGSGYEGVYGGSADSVYPTDGLVVYHALESGSNTYSSIFSADNPATVYTTPYELMLVEANPAATITPWYDDPNPGLDDGLHSADVNTLSDTTSPSLRFWSGSGRTTASGLVIHSVSGRANDTMTFVVGTGDLTGPPEISLSTAALAPTCEFEANAVSQTFAVANSGGGTLNYTVSDDVSWLSVSPASGTVSTGADLLTVSYDTAALAPGTHVGTITVRDPAASNTPRTISVTLTVHAQGVIALSSTSMAATLATGSTSASSFVIANSGGGTLTYTLTPSVSWLRLDRSGGTVAVEDDQVWVTFDATGLFAGVYNATVTVDSANASNSPRTIDVTMTVNGHIAVLAPAGGEELIPGNTSTLSWLTDAYITGPVRVDLYQGGSFSSSIVASTPNTGHYDWTVPAGQTPGADYRIRVTSLNEPTESGESGSDFGITALPALMGLPYSESFETGIGGWTQRQDDDIDWTAQSGNTPSSVTGPSAAFAGSNYIYTEASYPNYPDKRAVLNGFFDLRTVTAPLMDFAYHMYGADMGSMTIAATTDNATWTTLFNRSGDLGTTWQQASLDLSAYAGQVVQLRITGQVGSGYRSDMALDALTIGEATKYLQYAPTVLSESAANDGSVPGTVAISLTGDTFTADVVTAGLVSAANVPAGLTPVFVRNSDTTITFSLSGTALNHDSRDSIVDLRIVFSDGAFAGNNASVVAGAAQLLTLDFSGSTPPVPEMEVTGNNVAIVDGDATPSTGDHTDFGTVAVGATREYTYTISNSGTGDLHLGGTPLVSITGSGAGAFSVIALPASTVPPGGSTTFTIRFGPATAQVYNATLSIANDDSDENPYDFTVVGTGIVLLPEVEVRGNGVAIKAGDTTPSGLDLTDFGTVRLSTGGTDHEFIIVNLGSGVLHLTGTPLVTVTGSSAFSMITQPASTVAAGSSTIFTVRYGPRKAGEDTAEIAFFNDDSDENPYTMTVRGVGTVFPWTLFMPALLSPGQ